MIADVDRLRKDYPYIKYTLPTLRAGILALHDEIKESDMQTNSNNLIDTEALADIEYPVDSDKALVSEIPVLIPSKEKLQTFLDVAQNDRPAT
jgi:hypothetical protein